MRVGQNNSFAQKKKSSPQIEHTGHNSRIQIARFSFLSKFWLAVPMHLRSDLENFGHTRAIYIIASGRRMTWKHVYLAASGVIREWGCCSPRTVTVKSGVLSTAPSSGATSPSSSGSWPPIMPVCLCGQELHGSRCGTSTKWTLQLARIQCLAHGVCCTSTRSVPFSTTFWNWSLI